MPGPGGMLFEFGATSTKPTTTATAAVTGKLVHSRRLGRQVLALVLEVFAAVGPRPPCPRFLRLLFPVSPMHTTAYYPEAGTQ